MSLSEDEEDFQSADEGSQFEEDEAEAKRLSSTAQKKEVAPERPPEETAKPERRETRAERSAIEDSQQDSDSKVDQEEEDEEEEGDDEGKASTQRIRERNLRIARKFSAELAKNVKASAPIPVNIKSDNDSETHTPDSANKSSSSHLPPAPPPTPALSSSFNNEEGNAWTATGSQYNWRVPPAGQVQKTSAPAIDAKSEQARLALDRLSESASSQADSKNLFERVAEDIKKVSIRGADEPAAAAAAIPLISDLGSSLGGWGWGGATKLLASATQVTSQVTSALESVLLPSQEQVEAFHAELEASKRAAAAAKRLGERRE